MTKIASIPTMFSRGNVLGACLRSLLPQMDTIIVILDDFNLYEEQNFLDTIPELSDKKVVWMNSKMKKGSSARFLSVEMFKEEEDVFFFFCDDDLIYPREYADYSITRIDRIGRDKIYSYHGRRFWQGSLPLQSICKAAEPTPGRIHEVFPCLKEVQKDEPADILGTGVMVFHSDAMRKNRITHASFGPMEGNLDDAKFSMLCRMGGKDMLVLAHPDEWIQYNSGTFGYTIWDATMKNQGPLLDLINSYDWRNRA